MANHRRATWDEATDRDGDSFAAMAQWAALKSVRRNQCLALIDARHMAYRAIHTRKLNASDGTDTSALHGLLSMGTAVCDALNTTRYLFVWDGALQYKRDIYSQYKSRHDRARTEEEQAEHERGQQSIRTAALGMKLLRVPQVFPKRIECDDAIGLLARFAASKLYPKIRYVVIVSDDKDFFQLISPRVVVWRGTKAEVVGPEEFAERYKFPPIRYADWKALVGESETGDNIPGVRGVGEKTATAFIEAHGDWESVVAACQEKAKQPKSRKIDLTVAQSRDDIELSYKLSRILRHWRDMRDYGFTPMYAKQEISRLVQGLKYGCSLDRSARVRDVMMFKAKYDFESLDPRQWARVTGTRLVRGS